MTRGRPHVPEREVAKAAGEKYYDTGKLCANGHSSKRYTSTGYCVQCVAKNVKNSTARHPDHPAQAIARAAGILRYSTGEPCRNGHMCERYVHNGNCVECRAACQIRFHETHPGASAEIARRHRAKSPESHRRASIKWAKAHPENVRKNMKATFERNPELWRKRKVAYAQNYQATKRANGGQFTDADIDAIFTAQDGKCAGCSERKKLEIDHIMPVSRGGSNDRSNLQLLCRRCNASKGAKTMAEWLQSTSLST